MKRLILALAILLGLLPTTWADDGPVRVKIVRPESRKLKRPVEQPGTVRADQESPLAAKITGYVTNVRVEIGDRVKAGQILVEISVPELDKEAEQKAGIVRQMELAVKQGRLAKETMEAQVGTALALVKEAQAGMKRADANYARWSGEAERITKLATNKVVDPETRDETINQARAADAARDEAAAKVGTAAATLKRWQTELARAEVDILAEEAKRDVAKADAERVQALREYKTMKAPFEGVITRRMIDPGYLIQPGKLDVLLVIASVDKVRVAVDVPETDAALVHKGDKARVRVPALDGREFTGAVARTSWSLDPQNRTLRVEIDLANESDLLRPGMFVTAGIDVNLAAVKVIPTRALSKAGETHACFVVQDGKTVRLRVKAGRSDGEWTEVVQKQNTDGVWVPFAGDEEVVADPAANLAAGQVVEVLR